MQRIAAAAARLIAEEGLSDYTAAKRKGARSLGLTEYAALPDNAEVEAELRLYQRLFQGDEHAERLAVLRRKAAEIMRRVARFNPYLSGPVLDGTAARHAEIDIQLFTDSAKDVEIFLLNQGVDFNHSVPRSERAEAVFSLSGGDVVTNLIVYPAHLERTTFKTRDGRTRPRMRLDGLEKLLAAESETTDD